MVQLANSEQLAVRYAPYIQELREFFALHDVLCGAPRELGFFAARLSGRDTFPDELASMVRSFIFREGGAFPLTDLRAVVAIAVGGPAVAQSAGELQHPLHDLSTFLAAVARSPLDQPPPTPRPAEAADRTETVPLAATPLAEPLSDTAETFDYNNPFRPPLASGAGLTPSPSPFSAPSKQIGLAAPLRPVRNRRALWAGLAVGLPLVLLFAFLYYQPTQTTPSPDAGTAPSGPPASSLSAPQAAASPTPLSNAAEALAHPTSATTAHTGVSSPSLSGQPRPAVAGQTTLSAASPLPTAPSQPPAVPAATPSSSPASATAAVEPPNRAPSPPPASASTSKASSPAAPSSTSHAAPANPSVATVTAQQGAFGVSSGIMSSHLVSFSPPKYPVLAGFTHAQGQVILQAVVSKTGRVSAVKAITGPRTLRKAAETAVKQWRYRPYIVDGHAADVATIITIDVKSPHP